MRYTFFFRGPFSQWHYSPFSLEGRIFVTTEQFMMYRKALAFGDMPTAEAILRTEDPSLQKRLGRAVSPYDDEYWSSIADDIVYYGNYAKFTAHERLRMLLFATGDTFLVEASPYDCRWGIGLAEDDPRAIDPTQWRGENRLGKILTKLRDDLRGTYGSASK